MNKIAVVGGGIAGLSAAYYLRDAVQVDVFERHRHVGGLARCFPVAGTHLERFFHHFFHGDQALLGLFSELGLDREISFFPSSVGMIHTDRVEPFSTPQDLLRSNHLSWGAKMAFALHTLYLGRSQNWQALERHGVEEWLSRRLGREVYQRVWGPLLRAKFGEHAGEVNMAWLWGRIHPRAASRQNGRESLGYLRGGLVVALDRMVRSIQEAGGEVRTLAPADMVEIKEAGVDVWIDGERRTYQAVIMALDNQEVLRLAPGLEPAQSSRLRQVKYFGNLCMVLELTQPLGHIYWLNNTLAQNPLSGLIEHTNLVPTHWYQGRHIVYLFRYLSSDHPLFALNDDDLQAQFLWALADIYPKFDKDQIVSRRLFRAARATPVYSGRYGEIKPSFELSPGRLYLLNTSQIYPEDRNLSHGIFLARKLAEQIKETLRAQ